MNFIYFQHQVQSIFNIMFNLYSTSSTIYIEH